MFDLNHYQKELYRQQRNEIGIFPPAILALGLAERSGETCSLILSHTINSRAINNEELMNDVKTSVGALIAYALQLYASLDINAEETLNIIFESILEPMKEREKGLPNYIYNDEKEQEVSEQGSDDEEEGEPEKSVFEN